MPCWTIHLGVCDILGDELHLNKDLYLFGGVLPDVIKTNPYGRKFSHYYGNKMHSICVDEPMIEIDRFLKDYKNVLSDDLILGYYTHLLTDYYYNDYIYSKVFVTDSFGKVIGIKLKDQSVYFPSVNDHDTRRNIKQSDFLSYGKYLYDNKLIDVPKNKEIIKKYLGLLKDSFISEKEVDYKIDYLNSKLFDYNNRGFCLDDLMLLSKESYDELFEECISYVKKKIK